MSIILDCLRKALILGKSVKLYHLSPFACVSKKKVVTPPPPKTSTLLAMASCDRKEKKKKNICANL